MQLSTAATMLEATFHGADRVFDGVSIDTRVIEQGDLFVAIRGEKADGHEFVEMAKKAGAAAAMVSSPVDCAMPQLVVDDTTIALGQLGATWRERFDLPVLGITGSNGKTTVTRMVSTILASSGDTISPQGSFNNQWGVPLTLLKIREHTDYAVIEMGMNHPGEIDFLTRLTKPTAVLINNAAAAHLEGLGSLEAVAAAKSEIINGLDEDGVVVLNVDDPFFEFWNRRAKPYQVKTFGMSDSAEVTASNLQSTVNGSKFTLHVAGESQLVNLAIPGQHNVLNALAATAIATTAGVGLALVAQGLNAMRAVSGRLDQSTSKGGALLIDDSFNANPGSVMASIDVLKAGDGKKLLVLGAMAELGEQGRELHRQVGEAVRVSGIDRLLVLTDSGNPDLAGLAEGFGSETELFETPDLLVAAIAKDDHPTSTILVKGSKSSRMGRIIERLQSEQLPEGSC